MTYLIRLKVSGLNLDKLLMRIQSNSVSTYEVRKINDTVITFSIKNKDLKQVEHLINVLKLNYEIFGLRKLDKFIKKYFGILLGVIIFFSSLYIYNLFIWDIKVYGNYSLNDSEVISVLKQSGIKTLMRKNLDSKNIETILKNNFDKIADCSVAIQGTTIVINISEKQILEDLNFKPIIATASGVIKDYTLISGTMAVKVGDVVKSGDILVYPFIENPDGKQVAVKPICEIKSLATLNETIKTYESEIVTYKTGNSYKEYDVYLGNVKILQNSHKKEFAIFETSCYTENVLGILPIRREYKEYFELKTKLVQNDLENLKDSKLEQVKALALNKLPNNVNLISTNCYSLIIEGVLYSTASIEYECVISQ